MDPEINKQYKPSLWSHRYAPDIVVDKHIEVVEKASNKAKAHVPCQTGVQYGPTEGQRADIFGGDSLPRGSPIFVFIHGGYWQALHRDVSSYCVQPLYNAGIRVIVLDYDLAPKVALSEIVEEINNAGEFILKIAEQYGSKSIVLSGHSAGATLVLTLLLSNWFKNLPEEKQKLFTGVVLVSGLYDLAPIVFTENNDALQLTEEEIQAHSVLNKIFFFPKNVKESTYFLVAVAEHDPPGFLKQSELLVKALKEADCNKSHFLLVSKVDHFDIVEKLEDEQYLLTEKVIKLLKSGYAC